MKAAVQTGYGSAGMIEIREVAAPVIGKADVLVRVRAASLAAGDYFGLRGRPLPARLAIGIPRPKRDYVVGSDLAGVVEAIGSDVSGLKPGDEVFGATGHTCAELVRAAPHQLAAKPANLTFEHAAAVPTSALAALHALRDQGRVRPGQKVLINGASGGVGPFAVQIAKAFGAEVTGVCSPRNVAMVRSAGADHVIDYTREDFTLGTPRYDVILDNVASHSFAAYRRVLNKEGVVIPSSGHGGMRYILAAALLSIFVHQQGRPLVSNPKHEDLVALKDLIEGGRVKPVIDRTYPLDQTAAALGYLDEGHAQGKVVVTVTGGT